MNYLGHAILSYDHADILVGNMLGDFVKGKQFNKYPDGIRQGILYHRRIDEYTDNHPSVRAATTLLRLNGYAGHGAGVFIDIFFDHFLANDQIFFSTPYELEKFTLAVIEKLQNAEYLMTPKMKTYFGYMIRYNWLYHYHTKEGIEKSILGIVQRYPHLGNANEISFSLFNNIEMLRLHYRQFMQDALSWSKAIFQKGFKEEK